MRNLVLTRNDKLCFSIEELPTCEGNVKPKEAENRNVGFVCYRMNDPESKHLLINASKRVLTELESLDRDFTEIVEVAKRC
ncbi:DNA-directed RNA polymerase subunit alpha [Nephila pilipes]|uniref:DNA-directed RNA polymerase subunit alpha n=1 Tax=Nephila pilipes TaxID=299642 RepID=A0A8X6NWI1_NEPPI|nr:DNA-directed RNA polymerase subunit alpha [Nephila pilipes]